jgi:hypothetical protein
VLPCFFLSLLKFNGAKLTKKRQNEPFVALISDKYTTIGGKKRTFAPY